MEDSTRRVPVPPGMLAQLRELHVRKQHLMRVAEQIANDALAFDRAVAEFALAHDVDVGTTKIGIDLDEAVLVVGVPPELKDELDDGRDHGPAAA